MDLHTVILIGIQLAILVMSATVIVAGVVGYRRVNKQQKGEKK